MTTESELFLDRLAMLCASIGERLDTKDGSEHNLYLLRQIHRAASELEIALEEFNDAHPEIDLLSEEPRAQSPEAGGRVKLRTARIRDLVIDGLTAVEEGFSGVKYLMGTAHGGSIQIQLVLTDDEDDMTQTRNFQCVEVGAATGGA